MTGYTKYIFPDGHTTVVWAADGIHFAVSVGRVPEGMSVNAGLVDAETVRYWSDTAEHVLEDEDPVLREVVPA